MIHLPLKTEALAQKLAAVHRLSVEETIHMVLEQHAQAEGLIGPRDTSLDAVAARAERTSALVARFAAMPVLDPRSPREMMDDLDSL